MTEEARGIGAALRAAREEKGWTTQDVGGRLRLMSRQIEAIEAEDFASLGQPVFARGFVRNYAKLLGLNPDELLEQMTRIKVAPVQDTETVPFKPGEEFWQSPWVLGGIAAVILLIAIPVGLYWWLNSGDEEEAAPVAQQAVPPPAPPPAPLPAAAPAPAQPLAPDGAVTPAPAAVPQASAPAAPPPAAPLQPAAPAAPKAVPVQPSAAQPPVAVPVVRPPLPFPVQQPPLQPVAPPQPAPAAPPAAEKSSSLRMQFDEAAWVQVRDSSGRTVHSGLSPAGAAIDVGGKAPFYLVVGNAAHVRVSYKGQPVDLKPYIDVTVARLTLNP